MRKLFSLRYNNFNINLIFIRWYRKCWTRCKKWESWHGNVVLLSDSADSLWIIETKKKALPETKYTNQSTHLSKPITPDKSDSQTESQPISERLRWKINQSFKQHIHFLTSLDMGKLNESSGYFICLWFFVTAQVVHSQKGWIFFFDPFTVYGLYK